MNEKKTNVEQCGYIDVTPRWEGLVPLFFEWIESGTAQQKELAKTEIMKLAKFVDHIKDTKKDDEVKATTTDEPATSVSSEAIIAGVEKWAKAGKHKPCSWCGRIHRKAPTARWCLEGYNIQNQRRAITIERRRRNRIKGGQ